jgi:hypothetical protein
MSHITWTLASSLVDGHLFADGCIGDLQETRGLCRGEGDTLCGMDGEMCCGQDYDLRDYGSQCIAGWSCDYNLGEYEGLAPSPAGLDDTSVFPGATCKPCGAVGQLPCTGAASYSGLYAVHLQC